MLGHSDWADVKHYNLQTLKDNLRLFTPEILDRINQEVVRAGHQALKKNPAEGVVGRCDSVGVETDVPLPTDINLLLDAICKVIEICAILAGAYNLPGWRQHKYLQRLFKKQYRKVQRLKHSTSNSIFNSKVNRVCLSFRRAQRGEISLWQEISHFVRNDRPSSRCFALCIGLCFA